MAKNEKLENVKQISSELNIDKNKVVEEIKKEVKESLEIEIKKKVDYESRNKLDKMERRIYRQKVWALIFRDIIILLFLGVIIYETKILYDNKLLYGQTKVEENTNVVEEKKEENTNDKEEVKDSTYYIEKYSYLLQNIKTNLIGEDKYYIYNNLNVSDIKKSVKLNMAYQLLDIKPNEGIIKVSTDLLKEKYKTLFEDEYVEENFSNDCINFIYNKELKSFIAIDMPCESKDEEIFRKIVNAYEDDGNIVIEAKVGILSNNKLSTIKNSSVELENTYENIDKLDTYKFVFKNNYLYKIMSE